MRGVKSAAIVIAALRRLEVVTRPVHAETEAALARRWAELPASARMPAQSLGRHAVGCEGTHGVFPKCNLTCSPCYHSKDVNKVRIDGPHTLEQVEKQMAYLRQARGPRACPTHRWRGQPAYPRGPRRRTAHHACPRS